MVILKELILTDFYFESWCGCLEKTDFSIVSTLEGCGGLKRTDLYQFQICMGVMVLKELIGKPSYFGRVWWS